MKNIRLPLLVAPLLFGAVCAASAAPHKAQPIKATPPASAPPTVPAGPFRDVPPGHWAAQAVKTLQQKGIVRGYPAAANRMPMTRDSRDRAR